MTTALSRRGVATVALVAVTVVWGSTFILVKDAIAREPVMDFLAWRFGVAALAMLAVRPRSLTRIGAAGRRAGMLLGLALAAGYITQTLGLRTARATVSGFITGLFVVFTPLVAAVVLRRRVPAAAWGGVAVATAGLALLSLHGLSIGIGEALTLLCALAYAVHIVGLERWSSSYAADGLAVVQLLTVAVLCGVLAVAGRPGLPPDAGVWGAIVLTGVAGTAVAFFVQTWAQARLSATRAAVVMTMEPVFAGVFGVAVGGDRVTVRLVVGALLVLSAMFLVELGPRHGADAGVERLEV